MKYCEKCKVSVEGERKRCPLCQRELRGLGGDEPETFPSVPTIYKSHHLFFRILIFASVVAGVVSTIVNVMAGGVWWSLFVLLGIGCMWAILAVAVVKRRNIPKNVLWQVVLLSLLGVLWDLLTGWRGWSITYVIPILYTAAILAMAVSARVLGLRLEDYLIYVVMDAVLGILPLLFLIFGKLHTPLPSLICVGVSIIALAGLFLFEGERMRTELKRRLHL